MTVNMTRPWIESSSFVTMLFLAITLSSLSITSSGGSYIRGQKQEVYGLQCSFAFTSPTLDGCPKVELRHRQKFYDDYMKGCYRFYSYEECNSEELDRFKLNLLQPQSMVNMTSTGYRKIKAPSKLKKLLTDFWEINKKRKTLEYWGPGDIYVNHWESPSYLVSVEDENLQGAGEELKKAIWDAAIDEITEWTGGVAKLRPVSLYGIREYTEGAVLSPHVDTIPRVSSGIINIAQDVDEPWPLEVYDRNGHAVNITMEPGEMILYESHSLIHGRPFPLLGRSYANIFIHFEPFDGWDTAREKTKLGDNNGKLPPYILPGSPEEKIYFEDFPNGWFKDFAEGEEPPVLEYAADGMLQELKEAGKIDRRLLFFQDSSGWTPLHEAVRGGHLSVVKYLVEHGANIDDLTHEEASPLRIAINIIGENHKVTQYLRSLGAKDHGEAVDEYFKNDDDDSEPDDDQWKHSDEEDHRHDSVSGEGVPQEYVPSIEMVKTGFWDLEKETKGYLQEMKNEILADVPAIIVAADEDL